MQAHVAVLPGPLIESNNQCIAVFGPFHSGQNQVLCFRCDKRMPQRQRSGMSIYLYGLQFPRVDIATEGMRESNFQLPTMQIASTNDSRIAEFAKLIENKGDVASLQNHLKDVIEGDAFKGSHRSGQFLQYIIDQAIAGQFDSLKERVIGMELFGRSPSYDTGDDAIVRVTASDVRKRLLQHYGRYGTTSEFRISLPSGSYFPEITRAPRDKPVLIDAASANGETAQIRHDSPESNPEFVPGPGELVIDDSVPAQVETTQPKRLGGYRWLLFGILIVAINITLWGIYWSRPSPTETPHVSSLPWSALFGSSHAIELITSDPNIAEIQGITGSQISISDYANHNYVPVPNKLTPEQDYFCRHVMRGGDSSGVDAPIAAAVAALAQTYSKRIDVRGARSIQMADLESDNNLIFLGSPRSDPWLSFFSDQLDFRFAFDKNSGAEFIRNFRPRQIEQPSYVPTALGWGTGDSFAIIALVQNPDHSGQVLLLAGANAEGTEAAGKLVTDSTRFSSILGKCGISPAGPLQHFEILLHLNTMAGSSSKFDMVACHILPSAPVH